MQREEKVDCLGKPLPIRFPFWRAIWIGKNRDREFSCRLPNSSNKVNFKNVGLWCFRKRNLREARAVRRGKKRRWQEMKDEWVKRVGKKARRKNRATFRENRPSCVFPLFTLRAISKFVFLCCFTLSDDIVCTCWNVNSAMLMVSRVNCFDDPILLSIFKVLDNRLQWFFTFDNVENFKYWQQC